MKKSILSFLVLLSFSLSLHAQQIRHERIKEALRVRDILGDSMGPLRSFMVNPEQIGINTIDSLQGIRSSIQFRSKNIKAGFIPVQFTQQVQSALPYEWNGGSMLPAKGYQLLLSTGAYVTIGKRIHLQIAPEFNLAQNQNYEGFSQQMGDRAWADRYKVWNTIDMPQQYGTGQQTKLYPGQSFIKYRTKQLSFGISSESLWWGPGYRNALIMSSNAPGFWHWTVETHTPIKTGIGSFEGQIMGGMLQSSGILPPRINSVYNGAFLYQPKPEQDRYMTGMVLSWNPKWTPNLYLGIAKASYLYTNDISNPMDVLPLQGFFGRVRTASERAGKKASMGSLFIRYRMPSEKAELYVEYGRKDISLMPWNIIQTDAYRRAYVAGFRKLFATRNNAHIQFAAELTQLQAPTAELIRSPDSWYTHPSVRQGYTHLGRPIGAGIGPGSNSQTIELSWVKGLKQFGLQLERVRYNSDFYYQAFEYIQDFRRHWIDISATIKADLPIGPVLASAQMGLIRSYNYQWWIVQYDPNNYLIPGNEYLNFVGRLRLMYRF
jgi:hypothetical protein